MNLKKHSALIMALTLTFAFSGAAMAQDYNRGVVQTESSAAKNTTGEYRDGGIKRDGMTDREASFQRNRDENRVTNTSGGGYTYSPGATHPDDVRNDDINTGR